MGSRTKMRRISELLPRRCLRGIDYVYNCFLSQKLYIIRVHTNAFSFANTYISMRPSPFGAFTSKTHRFEKALERWSKRKRIHIVSVYTVENDRKRIKMKTVTVNITGAYVCNMCVEFNLRHNVQFYRFRTFYREQSKTHQNGGVEANRSIFFDGNESA